MDGLNKQCQTGGQHKNFVAQCQCLAFEFGLQKIVLQKKKNFVSLNYVKIESIVVMKIFIFKKKFKELFSEKCKEISIESIFSKKNICSNVFQTVCCGRFADVPRVFIKCFILIQIFCQN